VVVHYDMPWNPVKIDQRNGRAVRIGQQREIVRAVYFLPRGRQTTIIETVAAKNRARRQVFRAAPAESETSTLTLLPAYLTRAAPAVALIAALRRAGIAAPVAIARRYRAGVERLFAEMAVEYVDESRVSDLTSLLERERIIASGASIGPSDR
jgi:hypothetical protein